MAALFYSGLKVLLFLQNFALCLPSGVQKLTKKWHQVVRKKSDVRSEMFMKTGWLIRLEWGAFKHCRFTGHQCDDRPLLSLFFDKCAPWQPLFRRKSRCWTNRWLESRRSRVLCHTWTICDKKNDSSPVCVCTTTRVWYKLFPPFLWFCIYISLLGTLPPIVMQMRLCTVLDASRTLLSIGRSLYLWSWSKFPRS